jgi:hypothetical protein
VILRVRVVIPPVLAAEADNGFTCENRQTFLLVGLNFAPAEYLDRADEGRMTVTQTFIEIVRRVIKEVARRRIRRRSGARIFPSCGG